MTINNSSDGYWGALRGRMALGLRGAVRERYVIKKSLAETQAGRGSVVLVEGGVGSGKSKLLEHAVFSALERDFLVGASVDFPCLPTAAAAFLAYQDSLHNLSVIDTGAPALPECLKRWSARCHDAPASDVSSSRRPARWPILVALDDVHRLDPVSLRMLHALSLCSPSEPVVWMLSRRSGRGGPDVDRLFSVEREIFHLITLRPLSNTATARLVADVLHAQPPEDLLRLVCRAGGNPRLIVELVTGLVEEAGQGGISNPTTEPLPARLRRAVWTMLGTLSPKCQQFLEIAAVQGNTFAIEDVAETLGETSGMLLPTMHEAIHSGLLISEPDHLRFAHELVPQVIAGDLPPSVCRALRVEATVGGAPHRERAPSRSTKREAPLAAAAAADQATTQASPRLTTGTRHRLNDTELTIAHLVSRGFTNSQIAFRIRLSPHTVNYHLRKLFRRLGIRSRVELAGLVRGHPDTFEPGPGTPGGNCLTKSPDAQG